jgi:dipeptidase
MNTNSPKSRKPAFACTTMIAGKNTTEDGSVIVAHSDDDVSDIRVIYVPARDWDLNNKNESERPVYYDDCSLGHDMHINGDPTMPTYNASEVRRYVGTSRGVGYDTKDFRLSEKLGTIPQVAHTYAYFDSSYGIMNEHQLMIGECTCGAKIQPDPDSVKRIFYSAELSRVALERCTKAKEAVILMGELIQKYGYYGTGETLLVGDTDEAWVMEMCAYAMQGTSGIWVAKRVPDNGFFVAANQFRIRNVVDSEDMLYSDNLKEVCETLGWWNPKTGPLDWASAVSFGEYSNPYYSLRRVWRALTKAKPSANLSPWVEDGYSNDYPFCVIPDGKLSVATIADIYRDHYEGTQFDMTTGKAAGPWGNPTRYENNPDQGDAFKLQVYSPKGAWERPISIYRCGMFWINQARKQMPDAIGGISWIGLDRPASNCLMPYFTGIDNLPQSIQQGKVTEYTTLSAWWAFNYVANYANLNYTYMIEDIVELQKQLEKEAYAKAYDKNLSVEEITAFCETNTQRVLDAWLELSKYLIVKYNNGCITTEGVKSPIENKNYGKAYVEDAFFQKIDYPDWWLNEAGYYNGPISYEKKNSF